MTISESFPIKEFNGIKVNTSILSSSKNYYSYSSRNVKYIVMHYTGNSSDTAKANVTYFNTGSRSASAHYFVDENNCYQSVALNNAAWAVGGTSVYKHSECRNSNSISIEMCCSGNYTVSDKTINNAAYLCAALCRYLGISANQVDTYVIRHYDVWTKSCPAQWASVNNAGFIAFKDKVRAILNNESEDELMSKEYNELKAKNEAQDKIIGEIGFDIQKHESEINGIKNQLAKYDYIDKNMPTWAVPTITKLVNKGYLRGDEEGRLGLTDMDLRHYVVNDRAGIYD